MIEVLQISNYEVTDTRLIIYSGMSNKGAVITENHKNVILLLIYDLSWLECFALSPATCYHLLLHHDMLF